MESYMELMAEQNNRRRLLRLKQVLEIVPVSRTAWWSGVRSGRYPQSVRDGGMTFWRSDDIYALIESIAGQEK